MHNFKPSLECIGHESNIFHTIFQNNNNEILSCGLDNLIHRYNINQKYIILEIIFINILIIMYNISFTSNNNINKYPQCKPEIIFDKHEAPVNNFFLNDFNLF